MYYDKDRKQSNKSDAKQEKNVKITKQNNILHFMFDSLGNVICNFLIFILWRNNGNNNHDIYLPLIRR